MLSKQRMRAARGAAAWNARRLARPNLDRDIGERRGRLQTSASGTGSNREEKQRTAFMLEDVNKLDQLQIFLHIPHDPVVNLDIFWQLAS